MNYKLIALAVVLVALIGTASAQTVTAEDIILSVNGQDTVTMRVDTLPAGLSGYNITVASDNATIADIYAITVPSWATLSTVSTLPASSVTVLAADLGDVVGAGASSTTLMYVKIRALSAGTANLTIVANTFDNDVGGAISPTVVNNSITVNTYTMRPTAVTTIATIPPEPYDRMMDIFGGNETDVTNNTDTYLPDMLQFLKIVEVSYTDILGMVALVIIFATPFLLMWIIGESTTLPAVIGIILGGFVLYRLPESYHLLAIGFIILGVAAVIYRLMKERL